MRDGFWKLSCRHQRAGAVTQFEDLRMGSGTSWNEDRKHFQGRRILTYRVTTSWPFFSSIAVTVVNARAQAGEGFTTPLCKHKYEVELDRDVPHRHPTGHPT